ncbi:MAG: hypothetical protein VX214_01255 [Chloroflexota bacterium]|nr:hypothetical protein [Chloroflexota bacterium]MEE3345200.1 hypothetical protein [Chloroflexota bacterium]
MNEKNFLKLGVKEHSSVLVYSPPENFLQAISKVKLPFGSKISYSADDLFDIALIFVRNQLDVLELAAAAVAVLKNNGSLWFAFPSKESQLETDLSESEGWATLVDSGWTKGEYFHLDIGWTIIKFIET